MTDRRLNEHHELLILNYLRFSRYQRHQNLKSIEYLFKDVLDSRLQEDTYTADEVRDMLNCLCNVIRGEMETELITRTHTNVLLLRQIFTQAERWHLKLQADFSELQNREELDSIKVLEDSDVVSSTTFNPPTPTKVNLEPLFDGSGPLTLLHLEVEQLKEANEKLVLTLRESETQALQYVEELKRSHTELALSKEEVTQLKQLVEEAPAMSHQLNEVEAELDSVRHEMATNLGVSSSNLDHLEMRLNDTQTRFNEVQAQLILAEQELERKFNESSAYLNMKKILSKKNDLIKSLRVKLLAYEPEEGSGNEG